MRIDPYSASFLTSSSAHARMVLPKGLNTEVDGKHILLDVLVFNGKYPTTYYVKVAKGRSADPSPQQAFEHI